MPYVQCCDIRGESGFLDIDLPAEFRQTKDFMVSKNFTSSPERFLELQSELLRHPDFTDIRPERLRRGYRLGPTVFQPPVEDSDFCWEVSGGPRFFARRQYAEIISAHAGDAVSLTPVGNDYVLVGILVEGLPPVERRGSDICGICGFNRAVRNKSQFIFQEDMWPETPIFSIGSTVIVGITDDLKSDLDKLKPKNVLFTPLRIEEPF